MKLTLLPTCLQCHLPAKVLEVDFIYWCHFITDMIVYTYAEFGMNCLENKWNITHCPECCVGSWLQCRLLVCRTPSSYCSSLTIQSNILDTMFNQTIQWMSKQQPVFYMCIYLHILFTRLCSPHRWQVRRVFGPKSLLWHCLNNIARCEQYKNQDYSPIFKLLKLFIYLPTDSHVTKRLRLTTPNIS